VDLNNKYILRYWYYVTRDDILFLDVLAGNNDTSK